MTPVLGVVGGTGLYQLQNLQNIKQVTVDTPYGSASAPIVIGDFNGQPVAFLARHGEQHTIAPHLVNYRANLWALHSLGVRRVIGVNAVGGIRIDMPPRTLVVPDQIIDYTHGRHTSYCDVAGAEVRHIDFSEPYTGSLRVALSDAARRVGIALVADGVYGATQGPRLETRAEIARLYRDGCDLVGMTGMPEAALARELSLEYACLAMVSNWAAGCDVTHAAEISLDEIFANLSACTTQVITLIAVLLKST